MCTLVWVMLARCSSSTRMCSVSGAGGSARTRQPRRPAAARTHQAHGGVTLHLLIQALAQRLPHHHLPLLLRLGHQAAPRDAHCSGRRRRWAAAFKRGGGGRRWWRAGAGRPDRLPALIVGSHLLRRAGPGRRGERWGCCQQQRRAARRPLPPWCLHWTASECRRVGRGGRAGNVAAGSLPLGVGQCWVKAQQGGTAQRWIPPTHRAPSILHSVCEPLPRCPAARQSASAAGSFGTSLALQFGIIVFSNTPVGARHPASSTPQPNGATRLAGASPCGAHGALL